MPEAAEVTVAARQLGDVLTGRRLRGISVTHPRTTRSQPVGELHGFAGAVLGGVRRHGKWIVVGVDDVVAELGIHLRMSGQLLVRSPSDVPGDRHVHAVFDLGEQAVWFRDPRTFGELRVLHGGAPVAADLFDPSVTAERYLEHCRRRHVGVKAILLDQLGVASGIGSYLADEALHRAGISPVRPANTLGLDAWQRILDAVRAITEASTDAGGVTLADEGWVDLRGRPGRYADRLRVHARPRCATCATNTRSAVVGGRSARWCPRCQHPNRRT
ncbi:MAG: DNA-formamidopyrimidine glycosylase family protein [Acidimicrobiales bacterium]|nr:DNA-formamidopyrimidine glycosylase family protein [Acidimicrobiales bacterium]